MMRPTGLESLRGLQAALADVISPELTSIFAQDTAGITQALVESIVGEWDTAGEDLRRDNETLAALLSASQRAFENSPDSNESLSSIVSEIEIGLREPPKDSLTLSNLASRNGALMLILERVLMLAEDLAGEPGYDEITSLRRQIYAHLRDVATRGWSFWDISSFRERMAVLRSAATPDDV
jgi:hypothetical protein